MRRLESRMIKRGVIRILRRAGGFFVVMRDNNICAACRPIAIVS